MAVVKNDSQFGFSFDQAPLAGGLKRVVR